MALFSTLKIALIAFAVASALQLSAVEERPKHKHAAAKHGRRALKHKAGKHGGKVTPAMAKRNGKKEQPAGQDSAAKAVAAELQGEDKVEMAIGSPASAGVKKDPIPQTERHHMAAKQDANASAIATTEPQTSAAAKKNEHHRAAEHQAEFLAQATTKQEADGSAKAAKKLKHSTKAAKQEESARIATSEQETEDSAAASEQEAEVSAKHAPPKNKASAKAAKKAADQSASAFTEQHAKHSAKHSKKKKKAAAKAAKKLRKHASKAAKHEAHVSANLGSEQEAEASAKHVKTKTKALATAAQEIVADTATAPTEQEALDRATADTATPPTEQEALDPATAPTKKMAKVSEAHNATTVGGWRSPRGAKSHRWVKQDSVASVGEHAPNETTEEDVEVHLPDVATYMKKPASVLNSLTWKLKAFKASIAEKAYESELAVKKQKAEYEANMSAIAKNISTYIAWNKQLQREVTQINMDNVKLRRKGVELQTKGRALRETLKRLNENMTTIQDFVTESLVELPDHEDKTMVLREMDALEMNQRDHVAHLNALKKVRKSGGVSLLQLDTPHEEALDFVAQLDQKFDEYTAEQLSSQDELRHQYEEQYDKEMKRLDEVVSKQAELQMRREAATALRDKLRAAVQHLEKADEELEEQIRGLQAYFTKVGSS